MYTINKRIFSILALVILLCSINTRSDYAGNRKNNHMKCLQTLADTTIDMLIATRSVIAKNQDLINMDPISGNYYFKGFIPAMVGSEVANDFSLRTGHKLKQTSLKLRNPDNAPDKWEEQVLKLFDASDYPKGTGFGEILVTGGRKIYRYMKPIYVEKACLECHSTKKKTRPEIRKFLEERYPYDHAYGYNVGDVRGGISIIVSLED
ncbi:MAG: DUF3365 domain-containing protein [Candidatus Scalindua sp.]|nr:DUF3365 domain-containing protein [Candidatus Scalindua sp.]